MMFNSGREKKLKIVSTCLLIFLFTIGLFCFNHLHDYLSVTKRLDCDTLVIEGWLFDYMLDHAVQEIKHNHYNKILILCMNKNKPSDDIQHDFKETEAYQTSKRLIDRGIDPELISTIQIKDMGNHHTFRSALTLKNWIKVHGFSSKKFNIYTGGPHARKTYTAFTRVFGDSYKIGIVPSPIEHYNSRFWWSSLKGISVTLRFFIGYVYAEFWNFDKLEKEIAKNFLHIDDSASRAQSVRQHD